VLEKARLEQALAGAAGSETVDDHHVLTGVSAADDPGNADAHGEHANGDRSAAGPRLGRCLLLQRHHLAIDLHQVELPARRVAQALAGRCRRRRPSHHQQPASIGSGAAEGRDARGRSW